MYVRIKRARLLVGAIAVGTVVAAVATGSAATARGGPNNFREQLTGYEETPVALSTTGSGQAFVHINRQEDEISYRLSYTALEGNVLQAHIHFGAPAQSGGISVFLCTNLGNGPAGTQECPAAPATVTGTLAAADVIGPAGQGIAAGQFDELVDAIREGVTYVNVHSSLYPAGEIRGQIESDHEH
jgi:CHRD domain-containing protein